MRSIAVTQNGSKNRRRMEMALAMIIFVMAGTMLQRMFAIEFFLIGGFVLELVIAIWNDIWDGHSVDVSEFSSGFYLVKVNLSGNQLTQKLLVR